jgi:hypothetical protein
LSDKLFDTDAFIGRVGSAAMLARKGASNGECQAAVQALTRLVSRAESEALTMSEEIADRFLQQIREIVATVQPGGRVIPFGRPTELEPHFRIGSWVLVIDGNTGSPVGPTEGHAGKITGFDGKKYYKVVVPCWDYEWTLDEVELRQATQAEIDAELLIAERAKQQRARSVAPKTLSLGSTGWVSRVAKLNPFRMFWRQA